jgi:signal transduction histidine kinase
MRGRSVIAHYANPTDRDAVVARISACEEVIDAEVTARRRDGALVPVAMSVRRVVDHDGPIHEGVLLDLTDRKRAEEAVALRSVAELANGAAHEINNPLAVVTGQLEILRQSTSTDPKALRRIESAVAAVRRITEIISRMARITRLERLATSPNLPPVLDLRRSGAPAGDVRPT